MKVKPSHDFNHQTKAHVGMKCKIPPSGEEGPVL